MKNLKVNKVNILTLLLIVTGLVVSSPPFQKEVQAQTVAQSNRVTSASQREAIAHLDKAYELAQSRNYSFFGMPSIASGYAKAGQFDKALAVANRISDNSESQSEALVGIASAYAEAGQLAKADGVLRQAIAVTNRISPPERQRWLMSRIVSVYAEAGQFDKALSIVNRISDPEIQSSAIESIATAYAKAGQFDKALSIANRIPNSFVMADIALYYAEAGQFDKALAIANRTSKRVQPLAMAYIAKGYAEARQFDKALAIANRISRNNGNGFSIAMSFIAKGYAKAGQFDKALALINLADDKERTLGDIATAYAKAGQFDKAVALENSMSKSFGFTQATVNIATAYAEVGQFDKALAFANRIPAGETLNREALWSIAAAYADAGNDIQSAVDLIYPGGHLDDEDMDLLFSLHLRRAEKILEN